MYNRNVLYSPLYGTPLYSLANEVEPGCCGARSERSDWSDFFREPDKASMGCKSIRQEAVRSSPPLALSIFPI